MILASLLLAAAAVSPEQAVNEAALGLSAQIEDEDQGDIMLKVLRAMGSEVDGFPLSLSQSVTLCQVTDFQVKPLL